MAKKPTPWQRVFEKFGMSRRALGEAIGRDGSKISRAVRCSSGLIKGRDQVAILDLAKERGIDISPADLVPSRDE